MPSTALKGCPPDLPQHQGGGGTAAGTRKRGVPHPANSLPPGWTEEERTTATERKYAVYHGPNGERAQSRAAAWRATEPATEAADAAGEGAGEAARGGGVEQLREPTAAEAALVAMVEHTHLNPACAPACTHGPVARALQHGLGQVTY